MKKEDRYKLYEEAFRLWGEPGQEDMAIEEMSELIKELCKLKRVRGIGQPLMTPQMDTTVNNIIEEIADVEITIEQLKFYFGVEKVKEVKARKLERLKGRLERTRNGNRN
jgi:hypothetical protein